MRVGYLVEHSEGKVLRRRKALISLSSGITGTGLTHYAHELTYVCV